jgi:acetyl-CoA acetyltransferase
MSSTDLRDKYAFVGVGVTKQGKIPEMSGDDLATQAIQLAIEDAGINKSEIDGYIFQPGAIQTALQAKCICLNNAK